METSWRQRHVQLNSILRISSTSNEDEEAKALDLFLASRGYQPEVDRLRFGNHDFFLIGTLASGQFGVVDVVRCRLNGVVYARKTIEKRVANRNREQCFPLLERDILLLALKSNASWAPHLFCAFQTATSLSLVMQYADGGNLCDVLESSEQGRIDQSDLEWWIPQMVSAIEWCHSQGFVHRDIKPSNFVLTPSANLLLIDFGSAAPLLPASKSGIQLVPKQFCLVPCGTCDYISPEILSAHEEALVAVEIEEEVEIKHGEGGYGRETDWWSMGATVYELLYGVAPFFANDVRTTYIRIVNHQTSLQFDSAITASEDCIDLLRRLLTDPDRRWGRKGSFEIKSHPLFTLVDWSSLHLRIRPVNLHIPQFTYNISPDAIRAGAAEENDPTTTSTYSKPYEFSAFFQTTTSPGLSFLRGATVATATPSRSPQEASTKFIGFSWGPPSNILETTTQPVSKPTEYQGPQFSTPTPRPFPFQSKAASDPIPHNAFMTPIRSTNMQDIPTTIPRTGTARRTRAVSDREALRQMVNCVGMSARKKVLESGKKPRSTLEGSWKRPRSSFGEAQRSVSDSSGATRPRSSSVGSKLVLHLNSTHNHRKRAVNTVDANSHQVETDTETAATDQETDEPPSPSPRPGSALSRRSTVTGDTATSGSGLSLKPITPTMSSWRARSGTPTITDTTIGLGAQRSQEDQTVGLRLRRPNEALGTESMPKKQDYKPVKPHFIPRAQSPEKLLSQEGQHLDMDDHLVRMEERYQKLMFEITQLETRLETLIRRQHS